MEKETSSALHMAVVTIIWGIILSILVTSINVIRAANQVNREELDQIEVNKEIREWYRYDGKYISIQDAATKILQMRGSADITFEFESINMSGGAVLNNTILTWTKDEIFTNPNKFNSENVMKSINDTVKTIINGKDYSEPRVYSELVKDVGGTIIGLRFKYTVELAP